MSEHLAKARPAVDLDDFEHRLHAPADHTTGDPLAELARLVNETPDPYGDVFAQEAVAHAAPPVPTHAAYHDARREPSFDGVSPRLNGDFASIEAGLRGAIPAHADTSAEQLAADHALYAQHDAYGHEMHDTDIGAEQYAHDGQTYLQDHEDQQWAAPPPPQAAKSGFGRRPAYAIGATIAVCLVGVGVAFAYKGTGSSPSEIRTIMANASPTKIQPPAEVKDAAASNPAILGKDAQPAPTKLVSREEQPVDISQAVQQNASRNADAAVSGDASAVPVPPSPSQAAGAPADQAFGAGMQAPKRVKVVAVRQDGSLVSNDPAQAAAPAVTPAPAPAAAPALPAIAAQPVHVEAAPVAKPSTPKTASPKTTSRVAAKPTAIKPAKPMQVATAEPGDDAADTPAPKPKKAKPQKAASTDAGADAEPTASLPRTGGGFAIQLAAAGSESEARATMSRFGKKFAGALGGRHLGFHKAQSNGKSVFRVRVGSLSKDEATSLCEKLKADGGSCFIAKNN